MSCRFFLGTHQADWLRKTGAPLFVSARRLRPRKALPRAAGEWALDSGGFSELWLYGGWRTGCAQYAAEVRGWRERVGGMLWAAAQDWMCEEIVCASALLAEGKARPDRRKQVTLLSKAWQKATRKGGAPSAAEERLCAVKACLPLAPDVWAARVRLHQRLTVGNYLTLRGLAPEVPWVPVLQGYREDDYVACAAMYAAEGANLAALPLVGLGSVCRRQATGEAESIARRLCGMGIRLHGFGLKLEGLRRCAPYLASADSMAWSYRARRDAPLPGCPHRSCANCLRYALLWRERVVRMAELASAQRQPLLFA